MDFSTLSDSQLKDLFMGLRQSVTDGVYNAEEDTAYFTLLEYIVATKGQSIADDWNLEADLASKRVESPVGSTSSKASSNNGNSFPWWLLGAAAVVFMWRK